MGEAEGTSETLTGAGDRNRFTGFRSRDSEHLFSLFVQRVISPRRPDRSRVLAMLGPDVRASVAHVNGSDSPPHQRLLVELRGDLDRPEVLASPAWRLVD